MISYVYMEVRIVTFDFSLEYFIFVIGYLVVGSRYDFFSFFFFTLKNVSCEYDRWVVETQLCKPHDTYDMLIGRACAITNAAQHMPVGFCSILSENVKTAVCDLSRSG